ncbi:MAG: 50S ribosomal protein L35 [candidate division TM6 bacterium GW2011_GWF2_38_10]|nr:MAG: 50S ribosomal protein L35 [candidate division TM6 bacterium GW2011_GWF2_38_10]
MPKVKTNSACKKRFRKTSNGKIKRARGFRRHHSWAKSSKSVRQLRGIAYVHESQEQKIASVMPY